MKKLYTLVSAFLIVGATMAQSPKADFNTVPATKKLNPANMSASTQSSAAQASFARAEGDVINGYTYDFATTIQGWTVGADVGTDVWVYDASNTGPVGPYSYGPINTATGGSVHFDSDNYCSGDQDAWIMSPTLDLTGFPYVNVQFNQYYIKWTDKVYVEASIDGGSTWTSFEVNQSATSATPNPDLMSVNISTALTGSDNNVKVRFRYESTSANGQDGCDYWWIIDDVSIVEGSAPPDDDLTADTLWMAHGPYLYEYGTTHSVPVRQSKGDTLYFASHVTNNGTQTAANPTASLAVSGVAVVGGSAAGIAAPVTSLASAAMDTVEAVGYVLAKSAGSYNVSVTVSHDVADEVPADNMIVTSVDVTDTIFSWGDLDASDGDLYALYDGSNYVAGKMGNYFYINTTDTVTSAAFYCGSGFNTTFTPENKPVQFTLYEADGATIIAQTGVGSPTASDLGDWFTLSFGGEYELTPGYYLLGCEFFLPSNGFLFTEPSEEYAPLQTFLFDVGSGWTYYSNFYQAAELRLHTKALDCGTPSVNAISSNATCATSTDGEVDLTVSGITSPMYTWSNGATTEDVTGLAAGTYSVEVEYLVGSESCFVNKNVTVSAGGNISISTSSTQENCGNMDGSASVSVTGATGLLVYEWSNGGFNATETGLAAGVYDVTVSQGACDFTAAATVTAAVPDITITANVTDATCGEDNGMIAASADGGATPYSYEWDNGATTASISDLAVGTYVLDLTSAEGCMISESVTVSESITALTAAVTTTNVSSCTTTDGTAMVGVISSDASSTAFTYMWSTTATTTTVSGLGNGLVVVTVTDNNGCTDVKGNFVDANGNNVTITAGGTDLACNGDMSGEVSVTATGATAYTYSWADDQLVTIGTTASVTGLDAGNYGVLVVDPATACNQYAIVALTEPAVLEVSTSAISHVVCAGDADGSITIMATGGPSTAYTYDWDNGSTTAMITPLAAGSYMVTVTSGACTATHSETVNAGSSIVANISSADLTCNGDSDGQAQVQPASGNAPYTYSWTGGLTTRVISNLLAGDYDVTITDSGNCMVTATTNVAEPTAITVTLPTITNVCTGMTANVAATVNGGNGGNTYNWSNSATTASITVGAGSYSLVVTDVNGCVGTGSTTVSEYAGGAVVVTASTIKNASNNTTANGETTASATGGDGSYTYSWTNSVGMPVASSATATGLAGSNAGTVYTIKVTDGNGCTGTSTATVYIAVGVDELASIADYTIYPNPNNGTFTIEFVNAESDNYRISVRNVIGQVVTDKTVQFGGSYYETINLNDVEAGVYFVTVKGSKGERTDRIVIK